MRILFMVEALHPGGAERQMVQLMNEMSAMGHQVYLVTWVDMNFHDVLKLQNVQWHALNRKGKFDFSPISKAARLIKSEKIEVVQGFLDTGNLYAVLAAKLSGQNPRIFASERSSKRKLSFITKTHKAFSHRMADATIANSSNGKDYLRSLGIRESRLKIIRNSFNIQRFAQGEKNGDKAYWKARLGLDPQTRYILCVARITPMKNHLGIVEALSRVKAEGNYKVLFLGRKEQAYFQEISEQIRKKKLEDKIEFVEPSQEVEEYYWAADLFVLFSNQEGSPNTPVEAMLSGLPAIITEAGDIARYLGKGLSVLPIGDVEGLTGELERHLRMEDDALRSLGAANKSRLLSLKLSTGDNAREYIDYYKEFLDR